MRTIEVDSTILNAMQKCLYYWHLRFINHWQPNAKSEPLEKGDFSHVFLKHYYSELQTNQLLGRNKSYLDILAEARDVARIEAVSSNLPISELERCLDIVHQSCLKHLDHDREMDILFVERPFSKVLIEDVKDDIRIVYTGIIDLAINSKMTRNTPMDHKTQGKDYPIFPLQNQFPGYAWVLDSNWVIVNKIGFQKKKDEDERYKRMILSYSDAILENWKQQAIRTVKDAIRAYDFGINQSHKQFNSCAMFWGCEFMQVCSNGAGNADIELEKLMKDFFKGIPWSPYTRDRHEKPEK